MKKYSFLAEKIAIGVYIVISALILFMEVIPRIELLSYYVEAIRNGEMYRGMGLFYFLFEILGVVVLLTLMGATISCIKNYALMHPFLKYLGFGAFVVIRVLPILIDIIVSGGLDDYLYISYGMDFAWVIQTIFSILIFEVLYIGAVAISLFALSGWINKIGEDAIKSEEEMKVVGDESDAVKVKERKKTVNKVVVFVVAMLVIIFTSIIVMLWDVNNLDTRFWISLAVFMISNATLGFLVGPTGKLMLLLNEGLNSSADGLTMDSYVGDAVYQIGTRGCFFGTGRYLLTLVVMFFGWAVGIGVLVKIAKESKKK